MGLIVVGNPATLTAAGAARIGHGFESTVRISARPADAIDGLLPKYPALGVIAQRHLWFRPLLETIAKRRAASAPLGLKLRLGIGALISMADMASDIVQMISLFLAGQSALAYALLGLIFANLAFSVHLKRLVVVPNVPTNLYVVHDIVFLNDNGCP
jgi:hypothetical protein